MLKLRNSSAADISQLQTVEEAAAQRFLAIPELAILARSGVTDSEVHAQSIAQKLAWLVEDEQGTILGFCYARVLTDSLYLAEVSSHPGARGMGVGAQLVSHVRQVAYERQLKGVTLTTYIDVPWNAPWYQKQGFTLVEPSSYLHEMRYILQQQKVAGLMLMPRCVMWAAAIKPDGDASLLAE